MRHRGSDLSVSNPPVRLAISPVAAHVRTVRLVAVATARQVGVSEELIDEIRLAVGEACARAVTAHQRARVGALVEIEFGVLVHAPQRSLGWPIDRHNDKRGDRGASRLQVAVRDHAPFQPSNADPDQTLALLDTDHEEQVGLAVLAGLVDDVSVSPAPRGLGTLVRMTWPISGA